MYLSIRSRKTRGLASAFSFPGESDLRRPELDDPEGSLSEKCPENFSLLSYDNLRAFLEAHVISKEGFEQLPRSYGKRMRVVATILWKADCKVKDVRGPPVVG